MVGKSLADCRKNLLATMFWYLYLYIPTWTSNTRAIQCLMPPYLHVCIPVTCVSYHYISSSLHFHIHVLATHLDAFMPPYIYNFSMPPDFQPSTHSGLYVYSKPPDYRPPISKPAIPIFRSLTVVQVRFSYWIWRSSRVLGKWGNGTYHHFVPNMEN